MVRLTADIALAAPSCINPIGERQLELRGIKLPAIENLSVLMDGYDAIDFTDNEISKLENFPVMKRLRSVYISNNRISRVAEGLGASLPYLETLILSGNRVANLFEIDALASLSELVTLSLLQNPVTRRPNYRWYVVWRFPQLRVLDFQRVTLKERTAARKFFASRAGKTFVAEVKTAASTAAAAAGGAGALPNGGSGQGGRGGPEASSSSAKLPTFSPEELTAIHEAIASASTSEEIERLERYLKAGTCPPELVLGGATAAEAAAAAAAGAASSAMPVDAPVADGGAPAAAVAEGGRAAVVAGAGGAAAMAEDGNE